MSGSLATLSTHKPAFLSDVEQRIKTYITNRGSHCIDIVEKDVQDGDKIYCTWELSDGPEFCRVLLRFVRHKGYRGRNLDSALTVPVCDIVTERFEAFYRDNDAAINEEVLNRLVDNKIILKSLMERLANVTLTKASSELRKRVVHLLVERIHDHVAHGTACTISNQVGHVTATTAGTQVSAIMIGILVKLLAAHIASVVAKIMASAFLKKVVVILVKKIVITAVGAAVLNFLAVHVGVAIGGSTIMFVVLPLLLAYMGYKIATFPDKIGTEVSKSVRAELSARFDNINASIVDKIFQEVWNGEKLVLALAQDKTVQEMMKELVENELQNMPAL